MAEVLNRELYLGTFEDGEPPKGDEPMEALWRAHQSASNIVNEWSQKEREIAADTSLSETGKRAKLQASVAELQTRIERSEAVATRYGKQASELEANITASVIGKPANSIGEQRASEIRSLYRAADRETQTGIVHEALDQGDTETLSALLSAPRAFQLLTPQIRQHILDVLAERNPRHAEVARLKRGAEVASFGLTRAKSWIRDRAGVGGNK